jgi:hypothetical protein
MAFPPGYWASVYRVCLDLSTLLIPAQSCGDRVNLFHSVARRRSSGFIAARSDLRFPAFPPIMILFQSQVQNEGRLESCATSLSAKPVEAPLFEGRCFRQKIPRSQVHVGEASAWALLVLWDRKVDEEEVPRREVGPGCLPGKRVSRHKASAPKIERSADASRAITTARTFPTQKRARRTKPLGDWRHKGSARWLTV